jgi:hypothetical protein
MKETFDIMVLIARPAAGKSELIDYLKGIDTETRIERFHIGAFEEIDDFPMLWTWFEEDHILAEMGKSRLHTTDDGYFTHDYLWDVLIRRIELEYRKKVHGRPDYHRGMTTIVEFARGTQHGGFRRAFAQLSDDFLKRAAILYIEVSYEESFRKNRRRFNPSRPYSILEHGLPDDNLDVLYRESDWEELSEGDEAYLHIGKHRIPYAVLENEDDVTTVGGEVLGKRLEKVMQLLWERYRPRESKK